MTTFAASSEADRGSSTEDAGSVYADFIEKELDDQRASKTSMEQRAVAVATTSGVLVTLLLGFTSISRKQDGGLHIPSSAHLWFYLALGALVVAVVAALFAKIPLRHAYEGSTPEGLYETIKSHWDDSATDARRRVAATRIKLFRSYQRGNTFKGKMLGLAIASEAAAVGFLAVAIGLVIAHS